jgi:peptidoglycan/xylan/chitin deacetylase (PgdA/CDA1 family)
MRSFIVFTTVLFYSISLYSQNAQDYKNSVFLKKLYKDTSYIHLKKKVVREFSHAKPGHWGEFVKGVDEKLVTEQKNIAFTFDACGGKKGSGYDKELIEYLKSEKIPATLFITGSWIDANFQTFVELSKDSIFEIENHGLNHKPCSIDGESEYGIKGTENASGAFDEMEANARKIEAITNYKPKFFRSATAFIDEACAKMAGKLDITVISFQVLSGDAVAKLPAKTIEENVVKNVRPGDIIIMHFNHPKWFTYEAMVKIVPILRKKGYNFVKLKDFPLKGKAK